PPAPPAAYPPSLHDALPISPASSSAAPAPTSPATTTSPVNSAATATPSPSGGAASATSAWTAYTTSPARAGPGLFPLEDRHKVLDRKSTRLNSSHVKISYAV